MSPSVLLLSAYDAHSHRLWRERLCDLFPHWHWHCLSLPPRHFTWRIRSNGLYWAFEELDTLSRDYDLLIATSMVDLATLRGLVPGLAQTPTVVYFHENQFAYPAGRQRQDNMEPLLVPIYSALCANRVLFNSCYNRDTFLAGIESFSRAMPEPVPGQALNDLEQATVIPVSLPETTLNHDTGDDCLNLLWNHRWEYDKDPQLLLEIIRHCQKLNLPMRVHIVGQQFREQPAEFQEMDKLLQQWSHSSGIGRGEFGYLDEGKYRKLLAGCDVVLSTALHDFQGLAIQEACQSGCSPLAPNGLAYPEYLPSDCLYERGNNNTAETVAGRLQFLIEQKRNGKPLPQAEMGEFSSERVRKRYLEVFEDLNIPGVER